MIHCFCLIVAIFTVSLADVGNQIVADYRCDFEKDTCGIVNQERSVAQWVRKNVKIASRNEYVMFLEVKGENAQFGRMITPYFEGYGKMCGSLSFDLHMSGEGAAAFHVEDENSLDIGDLTSVVTVAEGWRHFEAKVEFDDYVRFFFEGHVNPKRGSSVFAMKNVFFKSWKCA